MSNADAVFLAGQIAGMVMRLSAIEWDSIAREAHLSPIYRHHLRLMAQLRRDLLTDPEQPSSADPKDAGPKPVLTQDETRNLLIEMKRYILHHGVLIGECVAWGRLKQAFDVDSAFPASNQPVQAGDWGALRQEPCRFCRRLGGVHFLIDDGPEGKVGLQSMRCDLCKRTWTADSSCA